MDDNDYQQYKFFVTTAVPRCQDPTVSRAKIYNFDDNMESLDDIVKSVTELFTHVNARHARPAVLTSMQKDSAAVLHLARTVNPYIAAYFFYYELPAPFEDYQGEFYKLRQAALLAGVTVIDNYSDDRDAWINYLTDKGHDLILAGFYPAETTPEFLTIMKERGPYYKSGKYGVQFMDMLYYFSVKNVMDYVTRNIPTFQSVIRPMKCVF